MDNTQMLLSIEQQFEIVKLKSALECATPDELKAMFIKFYEQSMLRENHYKDLVKVQWGLE
jgi:Phycobilisome degradation protein nblA